MFESRRMILSEEDPLPRITHYVRKTGLRLQSEIHDEVPYRLNAWIWHVREGTTFSYVEDGLVNEDYLKVAAADPDDCQVFSRLLTGHFQPLSVEDLLRDYTTARALYDRTSTLVRLGIGAPTRYDEAVFTCVHRALAHHDHRLREAALTAAHYMLWPELAGPLHTFHTHEPNPRLKAFAQDLTHKLVSRPRQLIPADGEAF